VISGPKLAKKRVKLWPVYGDKKADMADDYLSPTYVAPKPAPASFPAADTAVTLVNRKQYKQAFLLIDKLVNNEAPLDQATEKRLTTLLKSIFNSVQNQEIIYQALLTIGGLYNKVGNVNDAITVYSQAMKLKPLATKAPLKLGQIHEYLTEYDNALDCYELILKIDPQNTQAKQRIAAINQIRAEYRQLLENR
jgi:tetratricopeptide (TPR) repeat protein